MHAASYACHTRSIRHDMRRRTRSTEPHHRVPVPIYS
jgi:hypothetical protein